uniref:Protein RER1 n=1 Tax=Eucampia antarctica TaxID=49252 RepID=A0A7S2WHI8_9STRA|mmetsp:Transcript_29708/g.28567  ORF Transcript_29708/g.28567 Transcript_29708/m.28567 type:complete len:200 (+) Transcript_29708:29-628(+)
MMEGDDHDDGLVGATSSASSSNVQRAVQYWLDKSTIHIVPRWIVFVMLLAVLALRIYLVQGYFIIAYGLGIFLLNNFIAFLSPLEDPSESGPSLPTTDREGKEFRPFARRLPEFKFWLACARGTMIAIIMTFFAFFDVPVFWPILLMYFGVLFCMTMKRQLLHMWKHKYIPISFGKTKHKNAGVEHGQFGGGAAGNKGR